MQYNFESTAEELIVKFEKKIDVHRRSIVNNLDIVLTTLGDHLPNEAREQLEQAISDILDDGGHQQTCLFTQTMNKIVREIRNVVKG